MSLFGINGSTLMGRVLKPAAVEAGLGEMVPSPKSKDGLRASSWVGFHTFRHTCATSLILDEKPRWELDEVQVYLGHADIATTRKYYVHLYGDDLPERSSVLETERTSSVLDKALGGIGVSIDETPETPADCLPHSIFSGTPLRQERREERQEA